MISDLHIGHKSILKFRKCPKEWTLDDHDAWIVRAWNKVVGKRDTVYVLGDVCMDKSKLPMLKLMNGNKILIMGNHDQFPLEEYQKYFSKIHAFRRYKGYWLSHAPIHPQELRGRKNIHGHCHDYLIEDPYTGLPDSSYINVCVEHCSPNNPLLFGAPMLFSDIVKQTGGATYD